MEGGHCPGRQHTIEKTGCRLMCVHVCVVVVERGEGGGDADSKAVTVAHLNQGNTSLTVNLTTQDNTL